MTREGRKLVLTAFLELEELQPKERALLREILTNYDRLPEWGAENPSRAEETWFLFQRIEELYARAQAS